MDEDPQFDGDYTHDVADEIRHRLQILRAANSESPLLALKTLAMKPLPDGERGFSLRVNDVVGMEVKFDGDVDKLERTVVINRVTSTYNDKKGEVS